MKNKRKHLFTVSLTLFFSLSFAIYTYYGNKNFNILETSVLPMLKVVAEKNIPSPPDIGIKKVTLKKYQNPTDGFNFYKYKTSIVLHNYGGNLINTKLVLRSDQNQKIVTVKNTDKGFSLKSGDDYVIRNYDVIFDGNYNGTTFPFWVELPDRTELSTDNNTYKVDVFESPAKISDISVNELLDDGSYALNFNSVPFSFKKHDFEVYTNDSTYLDDSETKYSEVYTWGKIYDYLRVNNSLKIVKSGFSPYVTTELESRFIKFSDNPFYDSATHAAYIKATNPGNGYYAVSDVLLFKPQELMTRAQFAKLFVDSAGIPVDNDNVNYFTDVNSDEWYFPYAQTIYNLGLLDTLYSDFSPDALISRKEVLRIALDYFDVDLTIKKGAPHFKDIFETDYIYPYAETFYSSVKDNVFGEYLNLDQPATKNYLRYLINEYSKIN